MQCPVCENERLQMNERKGIEIDYCPKCRGVWLDRGELDKIIERSMDELGPTEQPVPPQDGRQQARPPHWYDEEHKHHKHDKHDKHHKKKGVKHWLKELFD